MYAFEMPKKMANFQMSFELDCAQFLMQKKEELHQT